MSEAGVRVEFTSDHGRLVALAQARAEAGRRLLGGMRFPR